jgi:methylenetetrahydrofolate dehydrogenase (NADP+) / methenyltetrahydrofolate cyclohydrolase / formyltetrahydrofolate synthetase
MKAKAAEEAGIDFKHISIPADTSAERVIEIVKKLNNDERISGLLVQLPLGEHITPEAERLVTESVSPEKDVDGFVNYHL